MGEAFIERARGTIARRIRELREARGWTQVELAQRLSTSQSRLSEIEHGQGSLSAEQFLVLLQLFNASPADFVPEAQDPESEIQNALVRLGASHLIESENVVPAAVDDLVDVAREVILNASPRLIAGLAPVLLRHASNVDLRRLQGELTRLGIPRRLPWLVENTLHALKTIRHRPGRDAGLWLKLARRAAPLQLFLDYAQDAPRSADRPDIIDRTIRTKRTAEDVSHKGSDISRRWKVITGLQPDDFVQAIRSALGTH